jgi:hypothetical protein
MTLKASPMCLHPAPPPARPLPDVVQSVTHPVRVIVISALLLLCRGSILGGGHTFLQELN